MNDIDADAVPDADDAELERLRRLAFGRPATEAEEVAAAEARETLARWQARRAEAAERAERVQAERVRAAVTEESPQHALVAEEESERPASRWRGWIAPAAVGLVVGAVVVGAVSFAMRPTTPGSGPGDPTPSPTGMDYFFGDPPDEKDLPPGDFEAAQRWFASEQTEEDLVGVPELRPEFERGSVRLVHRSDLARVWLVKQIDGRLCLETTDTETQSTTGSCVLSSDFEKRAISVSSNVLTAVWSGTQLSVVLSRR